MRTYHDYLLYAMLVVGLNLGLRYDEIQEVKIEGVTDGSGTVGEGRVYFSLTMAIKNFTYSRTYVIKKFLVDNEHQMSIIMDHFINIIAWMCILGN